MLKFGSHCTQLLNYPPGSFADATRFAKTIRIRVARLGLTQPGGQVSWPLVMPALQRLAAVLAKVPGLNHEADSTLLKTQLLRVLSGRASTHPLRYLVWMTTWFEDLNDFEIEYSKADGNIRRAAQTNCAGELMRSSAGPTAAQSAILDTVCEGELSPSAAAVLAGVSYSTIVAWACQKGFTAHRRPKKLSEDYWTQCVTLLRAGVSKLDVAAELQVSVVTITRVLRSVPGLQEQWHHVRHEGRREKARHAWEGLSALATCMGIKSLRRLEPAAYAWLYRNDRPWLVSLSMQIPRPFVTNHAGRRIENADVRMAAAMRKMAANWASTSPEWTLDEFKRSLPRIEKVIRNPERWPSSVKSLAAILSYEEFERSDLLTDE